MCYFILNIYRKEYLGSLLLPITICYYPFKFMRLIIIHFEDRQLILNYVKDSILTRWYIPVIIRFRTMYVQ